MSDAEIIQFVHNGNRNAFNHLVEKYQQMVFRTCMGFVHNKEDAEDLTQEVFINAYNALLKFKGESAFSTWLYRIAINTSLNHNRSTSKRNIFQSIENIFTNENRKGVVLPATNLANPEQILIGEEQRIMVKKALDALPESQRTAFVLSKYDDLPQKEIAQIMHTTEGAVEALLQRAKANLKVKLQKINPNKGPVGNFKKLINSPVGNNIFLFLTL